MEFYSLTNKPETIPAPSGQENVPVFNLKINKETGKKELVKTGETNLYEKIQANLEQTLIYNILEKYENGDESVINVKKGTYGDFTNMPTTMAEAQQTLIDAENTFKSLPIDLRAKFNHSTSEFLASITNGRIEQILGKYGHAGEKIEQKPSVETPKAEVKQEIGGIKYE